MRGPVAQPVLLTKQVNRALLARGGRPLDDARAEYHIRTLDPRHAASGEVPDWYHPVA